MANIPEIIAQGKILATAIAELPRDEQIAALNAVRTALHEISPFRDQPVDCVLWVRDDTVKSNDYNPNVVAPPEFRLLERSIEADGYTMPIVTADTGNGREVVDGAHRRRVEIENKVVHAQLGGYLPVTTIREDRTPKDDRMASTMRHNLARGKHTITGEREIVLDLSRRNWSEAKIAKELGMDVDKVLRLKQTSGLAHLFADKEFSEAWEVDK